MVGNDHDSSRLVVFEANSLNPCRAQRLSDEDLEVLVPFDDVDLLALELVDHLAHP